MRRGRFNASLCPDDCSGRGPSPKRHFGFVARVKHAPDTVSADQRYMSGSVGLEKGFNGGVVAKAGLSTSKLKRVKQSKENNVNTDLATTSANIELSKKLNRSVTVGYRYNLARRDRSKLPTADHWHGQL